jgi:hypothetical protein
MLARIVRHEVEAKLQSLDGRSCGKSEFKIYGNGERRLTVRLREPVASPGHTLTLTIAGRECARLATGGSGLIHDARTGRGDIVPEPREGEAIEVSVDGTLIASGVYRPD